jgi:pimeloyl-ACP methyl ester carboxylesterase
VLFRPLVERLPAWLEPVVVAYPRDQALGYDELLPRVLESLPKDGPFLLLGESFSGPLAVRAAALNPPGLQGLMLCATFVRNPLRLRWKGMHSLVPEWPFRGFLPLSTVRAWMGSRGSEAAMALVREALEGVLPAVLAHRVRELLQVNVRAELRACPVPILYLQASHDWVVPAHNARDVLTQRPDAHVVCLESSHLLLQTRPDTALAAILAHAQRCLEPRE